MKSKTTFWGTLASVATAAQAVPELSPFQRMCAIIVTAVALGLLGYHATDCPPNCPGTDEKGQPRPTRLPSAIGARLSQAQRRRISGEVGELLRLRQARSDPGAAPASIWKGRGAALALVLALSLAVLAAGCTVIYGRSHTKEPLADKQGSRGSVLYGVSLFDSGQVLGKTKLTYEASTNGTWAPGVGTAGWTQQATTTGAVTIIQQFKGIVPVP